jgi:peptidoglycan/xylan/chitin deacetylase (PgdA/CDA1 family)
LTEEKPENMKIKRTIRNTFGWVLAMILVLSGRLSKARRESMQDGAILSVYCHNPPKGLFKKMMFWLKKNGYAFISCQQLIDILNHKMPCPKGAVWLSCDDGWKGNIESVIPLAVEHNIPITFFIYTLAVETGIFWWRKARTCSRALPHEYQDINKVIKSSEDTRQHVLRSLDRLATPGYLIGEAMTATDIQRIAAMPQVTIASHTVSHPVFQNCTDAQMDYELIESKRKLEEWTGKPVKAFAYPRGSFSGREKPLLKKHGYELAVTIEGRLASNKDDCYLFPRTDLMNDGSFAENICHVLGIWGPVIRKFRSFFRLKGKYNIGNG